MIDAAGTFPVFGHAVAPQFFKTPSDFRRWLAKNHAACDELLVGFYKTGTGTPSITWPESVEEALAYGWIDGVRRSIDAECYSIRFTPRKPASNWSAINIKLAEKLIAEKRMRPAGLAAYRARKDNKSAIYSYENRPQSLEPAYEKTFKRNKKAWSYFSAQPPWYKRVSCYWVMSAKKEETRLSRLATLIRDSEAEKSIKPLQRPAKARASKGKSEKS